MSVAELRSAQAPQQDVPSADELIARAKKLAPKLRERAVKAERDREIPQESVDEYIDAGLIHVLQPKRWGGYEHDHEVAFDIAVELGRSTCTSSAWVLELSGRPRRYSRALPGGSAARRLEQEQSRLHCHFGGADREGHSRARAVTVSTAAGHGAADCGIRSGS